MKTDATKSVRLSNKVKQVEIGDQQQATHSGPCKMALMIDFPILPVIKFGWTTHPLRIKVFIMQTLRCNLYFSEEGIDCSTFNLLQFERRKVNANFE